METFVNIHLPWIATLLVSVVLGWLKLSHAFGRLEAVLETKIATKQCEQTRADCVSRVMQEVKDVRDKADDIRDKVDETRESLARAEGNLQKGVEVLEDAVREIKKANGYHK